MEYPEPHDPRITETFSLSTRRCAAFAASTLSDLLSTVTSSTLYSFPATVTVGYSSLASLIPSISSAPPAAFAPVIGSNTPILMVFPPAVFDPQERKRLLKARADIPKANTFASFFIFLASKKNADICRRYKNRRHCMNNYTTIIQKYARLEICKRRYIAELLQSE